ncbi:hypothetical protein ACFX2B_041123 [Malus domestica]
MNGFGFGYNLGILNVVVEDLCGSKLVVKVSFLVLKLKESIQPNGFTYRCLIQGFCDVGDLIEASKIWNLIVDEGFDRDISAVEKMIKTFFNTNQYVEEHDGDHFHPQHNARRHLQIQEHPTLLGHPS